MNFRGGGAAWSAFTWTRGDMTTAVLIGVLASSILCSWGEAQRRIARVMGTPGIDALMGMVFTSFTSTELELATGGTNESDPNRLKSDFLETTASKETPSGTAEDSISDPHKARDGIAVIKPGEAQAQAREVTLKAPACGRCCTFSDFESRNGSEAIGRKYSYAQALACASEEVAAAIRIALRDNDLLCRCHDAAAAAAASVAKIYFLWHGKAGASMPASGQGARSRAGASCAEILSRALAESLAASFAREARKEEECQALFLANAFEHAFETARCEAMGGRDGPEGEGGYFDMVVRAIEAPLEDGFKLALGRAH